jgi:hypothetical protein
VTIGGANFVAGATVTIGGTAATNVVVVDAATITAQTPAHAAGSANVTITNPDTQSATLTGAFTFIAPPSVTSVSPSSGPLAGGTSVTITGANFAAGATVTIGGTAATNVTVVSATSITATTPAHAAGQTAVTVTNSNGLSGSLTNGFTYSSAITFVQAVAAVPQATQTTVSATYPAAQTAGDLNVVIVGWDNTTTAVQSVVDSRGNAYQLAIGPTSGNGRRQSIYYASGIASGANTVTVTFSAAAPFPDLRLLQYRGVTTFDVAAGATGTNATSSSGSATTTAGAALIVGANVVATSTSGAGTGFTSRIITSPNGSIAEDRIVSAPGTYSATAPLSGAGGWVMQMVIFK